MIKTQHSLLGGTLFFLCVNAGLAYVNYNDMQVIKAELNAPKSVQIRSNGTVSQWPIDNQYVTVVKDER